MSNTDTDDKAKRSRFFPDLKIDFPALLAINIHLTFALVVIASLFIKIPVEGAGGQLLETLKNIVLLMVGFYFGSSRGSEKKDDAMLKGAGLSPAASGTTTTVTAPISPQNEPKP